MKRWDDLDDALVGFTQIYLDGERAHTLVYSGDRIIDLLKNRDGMEWDEALDYIDFNLGNAYIGKDTPLIVWDLPDDWEEQDL